MSRASTAELLTWPERQLIRELQGRLNVMSARWRRLKIIGQRNGELSRLEREMKAIRSEIITLEIELKNR